MSAVQIIGIILVTGALAGLVHGSANMIIVEPYLDEAINIENQELFASGIEKDTPRFWAEYDAYREWQKGGQILGSMILGISIGSLFGIVFILTRNALPGDKYVKKTLILAGIMWMTIYLIPFLKYPANPPTVGEAETIVLRTVLYLSFVAMSGLAAVGFYKISKRLYNQKKLLALAGYIAFISMAFVAMPDNPDENTAPSDLLNGFRVMSMVGVLTFWISAGLILGTLWSRYKPHQKMIPSN